MTAAGEWMCPACARTTEGCAAEGCGPAGTRPPKAVWVPADALERQAGSFAARRSVLPAAKPAWGVTAEEAAHMRGTCDPARCGRCALIREMRGGEDT